MLDRWPIDEIEWLLATAHAEGLLAALAGRLTAEAIGRLLPLGPDYVAVRGAACDGGRGGAISAERLAELVALVSEGTVRRAPIETAYANGNQTLHGRTSSRGARRRGSRLRRAT